MYGPHTVTFTVDGAEDIVHPDPDIDTCGFETYLGTAWAEAMQYYLGPWAFTWVENPEEPAGGYWNGSQL